MSKLADNAKNSKLKEWMSDQSSTEKVVRQVKPKEHPRSYRFDAEIVNELHNTLARVNEVAPKKITEARLVKALILLSREIDEEKLIKYLKKVL